MSTQDIVTTPEANAAILRGPWHPEFLREETLPDLLEATAARRPDHPALLWQGATITYQQLNQQADLAAHHLLAAGVQAGQIVGLCLPRGAMLLIMQAAITKAGAAWLPFEADTPVERMQVCLDDAGAAGMVSDTALDGILCPVWVADDLQAPVSSALRRREGLLPEHPAYVIYTSGSTGKPKGVPISHQGICHFLRSENAVLGIHQDDKVYQGFSVSFDMSFEEIWISYLVGATLWLAPKLLTGDPDALPQTLQQQGITVLHAVPTLLALFNQDVPSLRVINLGGEMCPSSLVERWATPERQLFNTYGPTEATVSASLAQLRRGEPVTIGTPLPNYGLLVRSEDGRLLPPGEVGELCIIGPGVAHGYLGRPELTAEKFLANPFSPLPHEQRLYRTGDLARIDEQGQVQCLGRVDDQVKVRGFRVELGEIEATLCQIPGVGTAAVVLRPLGDMEQLVAFLVFEAGTSLSAAELREALRATLPAYMIPALFESMSELPRLTSGKIDRKTLRACDIVLPDVDSGDSDEAVSPAEQHLFAALRTLFPGQALHFADDFFSTLGGHSLLAARLISALRRHAEYATRLSVHDVYTHRKLGALAAHLQTLAEHQANSAPEQARVRPPAAPAWKRASCAMAQLAALPLLLGVRMLLWLLPFFVYHWLTGDEGDSVLLATCLSILVYIAGLVASFLLAIIGKRLLLPKLKAGRYPLYGLTYFRWWLVDRLQDIPSHFLIAGSPLQAVYLRAMGASIGNNTTLGSLSIRAHDLLSIGDGASVGTAVNMENFRVHGDTWEVGPISIGKDGYVGSYSVLESHTTIEDGGQLQGLSSLISGQRVAANRIWAGSPSRCLADAHPEPLPPRAATTAGQHWLAYALGAAAVAALFFIPVFPGFILIDHLDLSWLDLSADGAPALTMFLWYFVLAIPASIAMVLVTMLGTALLRRVLLPTLPCGQWPVYGGVYYRRWLGNQIQEASLVVLHGLYASIFAGWWFRLLGAKVGHSTEISTAMGAIPDLLTLGDDSFIADAVMLGDEEVDRGWMTLRPTVVGNRSFVGNGAFVPDGSILPDDVLIGVQSRVPPNAAMHSGQTWLGSPALSLPAREQIAGYPEHLTFRPSPARRVARGVIETLRTILPLALVIASAYLMIFMLMPLIAEGEYAEALLAFCACGVIYGVASFLFVLLAKWLLIGRYRPRSAPMWTAFVWRSEAVTSLYESLAVPNLLGSLRGTPWLPMALRCMGAKIGKRAYLDASDMTEFDCVSIGDDCVLHAFAGPQTHLFEDRVMKIGEVSIGDSVNIGPRTTVLYSAAIGDDCQLGSLSLVLKGESLPAGQALIGSPAVPWQH